jgi:hypothetical protein
MLIKPNKNQELFNPVLSENSAYRKWGFSAGYSDPSQNKKREGGKLILSNESNKTAKTF